MQIFLGDDRVYWNGKPENPQPAPKPTRLWILVVITVALTAGAFCLALVLIYQSGGRYVAE